MKVNIDLILHFFEALSLQIKQETIYQIYLLKIYL